MLEFLLWESEAREPRSRLLPGGVVKHREDGGGSVDIVHFAGFRQGHSIGVLSPIPLVDDKSIGLGAVFIPAANFGIGHVAVDADGKRQAPRGGRLACSPASAWGKRKRDRSPDERLWSMIASSC